MAATRLASPGLPQTEVLTVRLKRSSKTSVTATLIVSIVTSTPKETWWRGGGPLSGRARPAAELDGSSKKTTAQKTILPVSWGKNDGNANLRFVIHTAEPVFIPG